MIDAQEYLTSIQQAGQRIELKIQQVKSLREQLQSISGPLDKEQVSHTRNVAVMSDTIATIVDMEKEIDQQANELLNTKREALRLLDKTKAGSASILIKRFFENKSVQELGNILGLTRRQAQRKLTDAIREFQHVLDEEDKHIDQKAV